MINKLNYDENKNNVFIMRDDLLPQYFGGNKVRIVSEYIADLIKKNKDALIVYGSRSSNLCRVACLICAEKRIACYVVYGIGDDRFNYAESINEKIVRRVCDNVYTCKKDNVENAIKNVFEKAVMDGHNPYYIYGNFKGEGNESVGIRAYDNNYIEISKFEEQYGFSFDYLFCPSGTGITQAGLICGKIKASAKCNIIGVTVARRKAIQEKKIISICESYLRNINEGLLDIDFKCEVSVYDEMVDINYGSYSEELLEFLKNEIARDSIPLDHYYSGKTFFGMHKYIVDHSIKKSNILFLHTGGVPLFYEDIVKIW